MDLSRCHLNFYELFLLQVISLTHYFYDLFLICFLFWNSFTNRTRTYEKKTLNKNYEIDIFCVSFKVNIFKKSSHISNDQRTSQKVFLYTYFSLIYSHIFSRRGHWRVTRCVLPPTKENTGVPWPFALIGPASSPISHSSDHVKPK